MGDRREELPDILNFLLACPTCWQPGRRRASSLAGVDQTMNAQGVDKGAARSRRRNQRVGAVGAGFVAVPFIASMNPSAKARAAGAPVQADVSKLEPGALLRVKWRGQPIWVVNRTDEMLEALPERTIPS
jgi:Rieske Fe-S protein